MPNVGFIRKELKAMMPLYEVIQDAIKGSVAVKFKKQKYLPKPNPGDNSRENAARYIAYIVRAVFYNVTRRTVAGLIGQMFMRSPVVEVPTALQILVDDANGEGVSLVQLAKKVASWVLPYGRAGLYVDYPVTNGQPVTRLQQEEGEIRPTIKAYDPYQIINWRTKKRGALNVLSLVVLVEEYTIKDDGFELELGIQWRVLGLNVSDIYVIEIWRKGAGENYVLFDRQIPTNGEGLPFNDIPFCFIGSENNDSEIDDPPLFDLADINIAHYRNSADYEESTYVTNQPTPVITGLSEQWADKYFKSGVGIGAHASIPLPVGGDAKYLQATEITSASAAMEHKERQMVALGAKLVEQKEVQRTATEAGIEEAGESSILATVADNVSLGFVWALGWAAEFEAIPETGIVFAINNKFDLAKATPEERAQTIKEWQADAITFSEMRAFLRKADVATKTDEEAEEEIRNADPLPNQPGGDNNPIKDPNAPPPVKAPPAK